MPSKLLTAVLPQQSAQGNSYSPVDDARFKEGIPSFYQLGGYIPGTVAPGAITLGLYDIHYDSSYLDLAGGSSGKLKTILEELSHTVQFLQVWDGLKMNPYQMGKHGVNTTDYKSAKGAWEAHVSYHWLKSGGSYDNSQVEIWAQNNANRILERLVNEPKYQKEGQLCGFDLGTYQIVIR